jgi:hypothetical protein
MEVNARAIQTGRDRATDDSRGDRAAGREELHSDRAEARGAGGADAARGDAGMTVT